MAYTDDAPLVEGQDDLTTGEAATAEVVQPYMRSDGDLIRQIHLWFKESADAHADIRLKRRDEWSALAGDQWERTALERMKAGGRPALTLNMLLTIMAAVEGEERTNRQELKYYGEGAEDDLAAHNMNRILKWVMNQCGGEFALSDQFRSGAGVGEGWVTCEIDYFDDPEGLINVLFVDDEEMFDDPLCKDPTSKDGRYVHRVKMFEADEIEARWPGSKEKLYAKAFASEAMPETDGSGTRDIYLTTNDSKSPKIYDALKKQWAVLETWWVQIEPGWVVVDEATGLLVEKTNEELEAMKIERAAAQRAHITAMMDGSLRAQQTVAAFEASQLGMPPPPPPQMPPPLQAKQRPIRRIYQAFSCSDVLLGKSASPLKGLKRAPYVPFRALYDKVKKEWFGLLRALLDPQRQHNVEQSSIVQLMQLMPKASWMAPKGAYHNKVQWETNVAKPGALLEYNARMGKPEQVPTPPIPRHLIDMAMTRPQSMREISGVNTEMTGQRQGNDAGVVMEMRSKAAKTVLAPIFDNNRRSKKELGKVILAFIQTYVTRGRKIRVLGEDGTPEAIEMTEAMQLNRYDLTVEETNATVNDRIATLNIMQTTLPQLLKAGVPVPAEFVDLLPMAPHIRTEMKRMVAWQNLINGNLPPPDWQPGMPDPRLLPPPGAPVPGAPMAPAE